MGNNSNQQKKVLLLASLISLAVHTSIILVLSATNKGERISLTPKNIKIELVEIKTKQQPKVPTIKPKTQPAKNRKTPQPIPQLKPRVDQQTVSQKPKGEPAKRKPSKELAVAAIDKSNASGSESINKRTNPTSSKESTSIFPKETPRCRQCREPRIPRRAEKRGEEGYAVFRLYISASGKVVKIELLKSSGHSGWNNATRKAAMSSTFYPMSFENTKDITYIMKTKGK